MKVEIKVPSMGESVTEATVSDILVSSGSYVEMDAEIIELETDKVNQVLYAPQAGELSLQVALDDTVSIGQVIGHIDTEKKASAPASSIKKEPPAAKSSLEPKKQVATGHNARVMEEAFVQEVKKPKVNFQDQSEDPSRKIEKKPLSKIRKVIARRLVEAKNETAMLTTFNEVDLTDLIALRKEVQEAFVAKYGVKLGFMSLFVKAVVQALQEVPQINAYIQGEEMHLFNYCDIGLAVGTDRGLVVPVIRNCEKLSYAEIEKQLKSYAQKARTGGLRLEDMQGGGFTITNGGVYGSLLSTPILNIPQSGILGMHAIQKRPVVKDEAVVIREMMYLALSYDHRIVDGKEAVSFLVHIKNFLEAFNPEDLGI